jgi:hypothetical protein
MPAQIVLSLQRAGSAAVLSLQFPTAPSIAASLDGAGGLSTRKRMRQQVEREVPRAMPTTAPTPEPAGLEAVAVNAMPADDWEDEEAAVLAATALLLQ